MFGIILLYYSKTVFTKTFLETKNCFAFKLRYFWRARWREKKNPIRHFRNTKWGTHWKWNFKYATKTKSMLQIHIHNIRTASKLIPIIVDFLFPKSNSNSCLFSNFYYELCACPATSHFNNGFGIMATIVKIQLLFHLPLQCGKFDFKRYRTIYYNNRHTHFVPKSYGLKSRHTCRNCSHIICVALSTRECDNVYDTPNALKEITREFKSKNKKSDKKKLKWLWVLWLLNTDLRLFDSAVSIGISLVLEFRCFFLEIFRHVWKTNQVTIASSFALGSRVLYLFLFDSCVFFGEEQRFWKQKETNPPMKLNLLFFHLSR